jgi:hypothetical protein
LTGRTSRQVAAAEIQRDMQLEAAALHRRVAAAARAVQVRALARVVRADPVPAQAQA